MKVLALLAVLVSQNAFADGAPLVQHTYQVRIQAGTVACTDGIPPNGHNYPVETTLTFSLPSYDLWGVEWTNVSDYRGAVGYTRCDQFAQLLRPSPQQDLIGTVTQVITEKYHLSGEKKSCLRDTREEATLVAGGVTFNGVAEFLVGSLDLKLCN